MMVSEKYTKTCCQNCHCYDAFPAGGEWESCTIVRRLRFHHLSIDWGVPVRGNPTGGFGVHTCGCRSCYCNKLCGHRGGVQVRILAGSALGLGLVRQLLFVSWDYLICGNHKYIGRRIGFVSMLNLCQAAHHICTSQVHLMSLGPAGWSVVHKQACAHSRPVSHCKLHTCQWNSCSRIL